MPPPRDRFGASLDTESLQDFERFYLSLSIWPGTKDPNADVIQIQLSGLKNEKWETVQRFAIYRDEQGYRQLPPRPPTIQKQETIESISKKEFKGNFSEESEDQSFL